VSGLLKITDAASIAIHVMACLAGADDRWVAQHEIAEELEISENHLAKVCQRLVKSGLISAHRGPNGGIKLLGDPIKITLLDVYQAIEGPMTTDYCLLKRKTCPGQSCLMGGLVESVTRQIRDYFSETTISELAK
jgi:Rrf2 family protein